MSSDKDPFSGGTHDVPSFALAGIFFMVCPASNSLFFPHYSGCRADPVSLKWLVSVAHAMLGGFLLASVWLDGPSTSRTALGVNFDAHQDLKVVRCTHLMHFLSKALYIFFLISRKFSLFKITI